MRPCLVYDRVCAGPGDPATVIIVAQSSEARFRSPSLVPTSAAGPQRQDSKFRNQGNELPLTFLLPACSILCRAC